jgi:uncharacterized small protein (DUF1192 family)
MGWTRYVSGITKSGADMLTDDLEPQNQPKRPKPLDGMSIDELKSYVVALQDEIVRVEAAISAKQAHMQAVSALFKT